jgi:hypothetical protein
MSLAHPLAAVLLARILPIRPAPRTATRNILLISAPQWEYLLHFIRWRNNNSA